VARSGRGILLWIPKDVSDFLDIDKDSTVEVKIQKLEKSGRKKGEK